jgi:prepilin peptidase CpaA
MGILSALGIGAAAAWSDFRFLKIPNLYVFILLGSFWISFLSAHFGGFIYDSFDPWWSHLGAFLMAFTLGFVFFYFHIWGGGDAKIIAAMGLWVGLKGFVILWIYTVVFGGMLAVLSLILKAIFQKYPPHSIDKLKTSSLWLFSLTKAKPSIPYGIALYGGFLISLYHLISPFLQSLKGF